MKQLKLVFLIFLTLIGGLVLIQSENVCTAENVVQDVTLQVPAYEYREICAIANWQPSPDEFKRGYHPVYKISVNAWDPDDGKAKPIDLLILDAWNYGFFKEGKKYQYWGQTDMINGIYYFTLPGYDAAVSVGPYTVILGNRSEQTLYAHIRISQVK